TTPPHASADSTVIPRVATCTTVPAKPSSATRRLEPPPRTSSGSPARSTDATASTTSSGVVAVSRARGGPPTRMVVREASGVASDKRDLDGGSPEHLLATTGHLELDGGPPAAVVDRLHDARHLELGAARGRHDDRVGEPGGVAQHAAGVTDPVGDQLDGCPHRP